MLRIYADFNCTDEDGRVWLDTVGSLRDIEAHAAELKEGMTVMLYMTNELEVEATLLQDRGSWKGVPDWKTKRYLDG